MALRANSSEANYVIELMVSAKIALKACRDSLAFAKNLSTSLRVTPI